VFSVTAGFRGAGVTFSSICGGRSPGVSPTLAEMTGSGARSWTIGIELSAGRQERS
jgi:hypothetical protein